jgi:hypothetical protein
MANKDEAAAKLDKMRRSAQSDEAKRLSPESEIGGKFTQPGGMSPTQTREYEASLKQSETIAEGERGDFDARLDARILKEKPRLYQDIQEGKNYALRERSDLAHTFRLDEKNKTDFFSKEIKGGGGEGSRRWLLGTE